MKTRVALATIALAAGLATAQTAIVDVSGVLSYDGLGDSSNQHISVFLGANAVVTNISWDVTITTNSPSWLSEPQTEVTSGGDGSGSYSIWYGPGDDFSGTGSYGGSSGAAIDAGPDGFIDLEFWENFVDFTDGVDARYDQGVIVIDYVPAPGALALLGLGGLAATRRRR